MAVKASGSVTLSTLRDLASCTRYYLLQASTLAKPARPAAKPPGGAWVTAEPSYASGSTDSLYFCDLNVFSDGTYDYSEVSLSSSYEAAKAAWNKARAAQQTAEAAAEGLDALDRSLDQREIFDRLTGGGQAQGIYLQDGKLYINGSYLKIGTIFGNDGNYWILNGDDAEFVAQKGTVGNFTIQNGELSYVTPSGSYEINLSDAGINTRFANPYTGDTNAVNLYGGQAEFFWNGVNTFDISAGDGFLFISSRTSATYPVQIYDSKSILGQTIIVEYDVLGKKNLEIDGDLKVWGDVSFNKALSAKYGGTGLTASPSMLTNLGSTGAANVFQASPRPGVTGTLKVGNGGTGATTAAAARANLEITPANIGAFGSPSLSGVTDANSTTLVGHGFYRGSACANLPSASESVYFEVLFLGAAQVAIQYASTGSPLVYTRYYTNSKWYPWTAIANVNASGVVPVSGGGTGAADDAAARSNLKAAAGLYIDGSDWSGVWSNHMDKIAVSGGAVALISASAASVLSGGKINAILSAYITRGGSAGSSTFRIAAMTTSGNYQYAWIISNASSSSRTTGTVYRYAGTAI